MNPASKITAWAKRHRLAVILAMCVFFVFSIFAIQKIKFAENIFDILPFSDSTIKDHIWAAKHFKSSNTLWFNIASSNGSNSQIAEDATDELKKNLKTIPDLSRVFCGLESEDIGSDIRTLTQTIPLLFTDDDLTKLTKTISKDALTESLKKMSKDLQRPDSFFTKTLLLNDPLGLSEIFFTKLRNSSDTFDIAKISNSKIVDLSGKNYLLAAEGRFDSADSERSAALMREIEKAVESVKNKFPQIQIACAGGYRISADNAKIAKRDSTFCLGATIFLMVLLCFFAFRNRLFAPLATLPSMLATATAFVAIGEIFAPVSTISIAFASIAIGVSIDYAIHILYRLDALSEVKLSDAESAASSLLKPIATVSGTTCIAFVIMIFSESEGFRQLGIFGLIGVATSAIISVFILPSLTVGLKNSAQKSRFFDKLSDAILNLVLTHSRRIFALVLISVLASAPFAIKVIFEGDISSLSALTPQSKREDATVRKIWQNAISKKIVIARADNLENAKLENEKLRDFLKTRHDLQSFGLWEILPSKIESEKNFKRWKNFWSAEKISELKTKFSQAAKAANFAPKAFEKNLSKIGNENFSDCANALVNVTEKLLKDRVSSVDDTAAIIVFLRPAANFDAANFTADLKNLSPDFAYIDSKFLSAHIASNSLEWLFKFAAAAMICVSVYLFFLLNAKISRVFVVLLPVCVGMLWCFATMRIFGVSINAINFIFVVFSVCIAQDYAVFIMTAKLRGEKLNASISSVLISALTTCAAFGTLAFASHPLLKSLGLAAAISIFCILVACLLLTPALTDLCAKSQNKKSNENGNDLGWNGKSYGGYFGNKCFALLLKIGMFPAYLLLIFVAAYFMLFRRKICACGAEYLSKLFDKKVSSIGWQNYKLLYSFGVSILDKVSYFAGSKKIECKDFCEEKIRSLLAEKKGLVLVTAHIGGWAISEGELNKYNVEKGLLGADNEDENIAKILEQLKEIDSPNFIGNPTDAMGIIPAFSILKRGGIVAMHADRFAGGRFAEIEFLGGKIRAPLAAYILAAKAGAPILQVICVREKTFVYKMSPFDISKMNNARGTELEEAAATRAREFFSNIENVLKNHPYEWFNFYDFWR